MQPLSSYTLADPKVMQNPYPYYERLRAEDPVHFDEDIQTWLVTRHEDILAVARNTEDYSDEMRVSASIRSSFKAEVDELFTGQGATGAVGAPGPRFCALPRHRQGWASLLLWPDHASASQWQAR